MDNFKMIRGQDPPLKEEEKEGKGREGAGASIPQRAMRQYSPAHFSILKRGQFSAASDEFRGRVFGDGIGARTSFGS